MTTAPESSIDPMLPEILSIINKKRSHFDTELRVYRRDTLNLPLDPRRRAAHEHDRTRP
jgi:hypothetical protein